MPEAGFPAFHFVPGTIPVESMAQCGGPLSGIDGLFTLAAMDDVHFFRGAE